MNKSIPHSYTSFSGHRCIAKGSLQANAVAVKTALTNNPDSHGILPLVFDDSTGRTVEIDTRGTPADVALRYADAADEHQPALANVMPAASDATEAGLAQAEPKGRGRPKLGVVAREVTLLPRHWEWLASQPGGASVVIRKLVEEARRANSDTDKIRKAHERTYHFMQTVAGNLPDFEEATRALFANDAVRLNTHIVTWPEDVQVYIRQLAFGDTEKRPNAAA